MEANDQDALILKMDLFLYIDKFDLNFEDDLKTNLNLDGKRIFLFLKNGEEVCQKFIQFNPIIFDPVF